MKTLILAILLTMTMPALAATAYFTGKYEIITTVTGNTAWKCEYEYAGEYYWVILQSMCPQTMEVY